MPSGPRTDVDRETILRILALPIDAFAPLLVDESVAEHYGEALAHARAVGRNVKASDLLIIATASATGRTLHTLDRAQASLARPLGVTVSGAA